MRTMLISCITALVLLSSFNARKKGRPKLPEEFVMIPGGSFSLPDGDSTKRFSQLGFYMSRYEVSNIQYRQFFSEASVGMSKSDKEKIACDTAAWQHFPNYSVPMEKYYYSNQAYNNYPVVNVSYIGAVKYCEWLQLKIQKDNPDFDVEVKLPTKAQWIWAAMGGRSQAMFPWGNYYLRNRKGEFLCNFRRVNEFAIYTNRKTGKPEIATTNFSQDSYFTTAVKSFSPNDFGLYNMCGNAAEMIEDKGTSMGGSWNDYGGDVHIRSEGNYEQPSPTIGFRPIIMVKKKDN
jgi:sulfatase modifying factor 1